MKHLYANRSKLTVAADGLHGETWRLALHVHNYENVMRSQDNWERMRRTIEDIEKKLEHAKQLLEVQE